ncbi:phospholipid-transporting ATPase ABCA3-like [Dermacentor variabilis]|uniref:phospholipid-transporting ATPase ABCA3-like n=1 Tax=Dermacentor variabilis TaxID=34621 RepID=UPI003F5BD50E
MSSALPPRWGEAPAHVVWQLHLLLWKNLLVTQLCHHYVVTAVELLLPLLLSYLYGVLELDFSNALPAKEDGTRRRTLRDAFLVYWSSAPEPYFPADMIQKTEAAPKPPAPSQNTTDEKVNLLYKEGLSGHVLASLPFVLVLGMPLPGFAYRVSMELNSGVKELMEAYGVSSGVYWLGNLLVELVKLMLIAVSLTFLWSYTELFKGTAANVQLLLLAFFFASSLALCLLIASFATRPGVAALSVVVMTLTTTLLPVVSLVGYSVEYINMTRLLQLLSCLIPDVALTYAFTMMHINKELGGHFITLENMRNFMLRDVSLYKMVHAMVATLGGCLVLTMYVDRVWPGGESLPERPLFFADPDYWGIKYHLFGSTPRVRRMCAEMYTTEPVPLDLQPFVVVNKLTKNIVTLFRSVTVLNTVSIKLYAEHVTVLLGTNGSGKSLILKIVSGLSRPSGGSVYVGSGYDVRQDLWHVRHLLGYCPQTDALLDELSIEENLFFFARLRRMGRRKAASEAQISLYEFQLFNRRKERVRSLNFSDRRRLQLAIAMVGSPAYLLLDEPTVGVDLETKHSLWEIILKARQRCGILLVTNSIEEAELLGDRIAIISHGAVACCGSSIYLRKRHGSGYRFPMLVDEDSDVAELTAFIQRLRPSAKLYMERRRAVVYTIGYPGTPSLIDLLRELEANQKKLGITRIGVNTASLEDVMLRVHSEQSEFLSDVAHSTISRLDMQGRTQAVASTLFIRQVDALARKKFASGRRILGAHVALVAAQLIIVASMVAYLSSQYPFVQMHRLGTVGSALDKIRVISAPKGRAYFLALDFDRLSQEMHAVILKVRLMIGALLPVAMSLSTALRLLLPLQERKSEAKHLQLMTGLSPARYWTITFLIDMVFHVLTTLLLLTPFFIPARSDTVCQTFTYMDDTRSSGGIS